MNGIASAITTEVVADLRVDGIEITDAEPSSSGLPRESPTTSSSWLKARLEGSAGTSGARAGPRAPGMLDGFSSRTTGETDLPVSARGPPLGASSDIPCSP